MDADRIGELEARVAELEEKLADAYDAARTAEKKTAQVAHAAYALRLRLARLYDEAAGLTLHDRYGGVCGGLQGWLLRAVSDHTNLIGRAG